VSSNFVTNLNQASEGGPDGYQLEHWTFMQLTLVLFRAFAMP